MDSADLLGDWAVRDHVLTLGRSFDLRSFHLQGRGRGHLAGGWLAVEGQFVAEVNECSSPLPGEDPDFTTPPWLAAAFRIEGDRTRAVLRDGYGKVTARLTRIGTPPPPGPAPAAVPRHLTAVDRPGLLGCWVAEGRAHTRVTPTITFDPDRRFRSSDGLNRHMGLWLCGAGGTVVGTGSEIAGVGGQDLVPVNFWPFRTSRAGFDGEVLVLLDTDGAEVGRLERDPR